jgi:aspartyl/glutamyl-tRNA(Asn/Gln) amidotransferase C subunit
VNKVNKEILKDAANRLLFDMSDEEYDTLLEEFGIINEQFSLIGNIKGVDEVEPMTFPFEVTIDVLRDDEPSVPLKKEDALRNAGSVQDGQIKLPKVI